MPKKGYPASLMPTKGYAASLRRAKKSAAPPQRSISLFLFILCILTAQLLPAQNFNIITYGAIGDGKTDNTLSIQKAIDECAKTGGTVIFPPGQFLSGTLVMKSNVTLNITKNATLLGTTDLTKYPYLNSKLDFYGHDWAKQALIFCQDLENISITGEGTIDGQGGSFKITTDKKPDRYRNRPYLLWFVHSKNIKVSGVNLRNSAFWMQHYLGCESVFIDNINIWNHSNKNNDMLDIDGCRDVTITNIKGDSDDDGLTLKSTSPLISENITISNCIFSSHCNALKFGTESTGGFRNVTVTNCVIRPSKQLTTIYGKPAGNSGISLEMVDGGIMENITIDNIIIEGPQVPLFVRLGNRARKYTDSAKTPQVGLARNINISNIIATGADTTGCAFMGIPGFPLENISLSNISIETIGRGVVSDITKQLPELENLYPEATMFGKLPAYGFYFRHVRGVKLTNVTTRSKNKDARPAIGFSDVDNFTATTLDLQSFLGNQSAIIVDNASSGLISNSMHQYPVKEFVKKDARSKNIMFSNISVNGNTPKPGK